MSAPRAIAPAGARPLRVVIVDDEPIARDGLRIRLLALGGVDVVGEHGDAQEAVHAIDAVRPDVLYVDVRMPELDGFGLLERLEREVPVVVFVTAFAEHAMEAYRVGAIDYLLKPYDDEMLARSLERARRLLAHEGPGTATRRYARRLLVRRDRATMLLDVERIERIDSDGDHVRIVADGQPITMRSTMTALQARLDPSRFVRVHRTTIVAARCVRTIEPYSRGEHVVVLTDGSRLPLSRRYRAHVLAALERAD